MGTITASCGHQVAHADDLIHVEYDDVDCDPIEGFVDVTVFASFCRACADDLSRRALLAQGGGDGR